MSSKYLTPILVVLVFLISVQCSKDDSSANCTNAGNFTVTLNGSSWTASSFNNTFLISTQAGQQGRRLDIRAVHSNKDEMIITITDGPSGTGNCIAVGDYIGFNDSSDPNDAVFYVSYVTSAGLTWLGETGQLKITSCNEQTISGTFSFEGSSGTFNGVNGSFSNVCYRVLK